MKKKVFIILLLAIFCSRAFSQNVPIEINRIDPGDDYDDCFITTIPDLSFTEEQETKTIYVPTTCVWTATDNSSWISLNTNQLQNQIDVTCQANPNYSERTGLIRIYASSEVLIVTVNQDAKSCYPSIFELNGNSTSRCPDEPSYETLSLNNSEVGVDYTLLDGANPISTKSGTGTSISWNVAPEWEGTHNYTVKAKKLSTSCEIKMAGSVSIIVQDQPAEFMLTKSGNICSGYDIELNSCQEEVGYTLLCDNQPVASRMVKVGGGGRPLYFGLFDEPGTYHVEARANLTGCTNIMSSTVIIDEPTIPSVSSPISKTVCENGMVTYTVTGNNIDTYHWQEKSPGGNFIDKSVQSNSITLENISYSMDGYQYRIIGEGMCESDTSDEATLNVNPQTNITLFPEHITQPLGSEVTFRVYSQGTNITYQWQKQENGDWQNVADGNGYSGSNTRYLAIDQISYDHEADYRVVVSGDCGSDTAKTYLRIVNEADYNVNPTLGINREISTDMDVGSIGGSFSTNSNGAATYSIPITVPEGINGMVPSLNINYSSQSSNGVLGWGWNLSGLSRITRGTTSILHEGFISNMNYSDNDRYFLDGARLILTKGIYGAPGSEYRTELDHIAKIRLLSSNESLYFLVYTANGKILTYGRDEDSKKIISNGKTAYWSLNEKKDFWGNVVSYHYIEAHGQKILDRIEYANNKVDFEYEDRTNLDGNTIYIFGEPYKTSNILKKINIYSESEIYREYGFQYTRDIYLMLNEVTMKSGENSQVNSTVINWNKGGSSSIENLGLDLEQRRQYGDFNGDGRSDILTGKEDAVSSTVYIKNENGFDTYTFNKGQNFKDLRIGDFDYDGKDEIFLGTVIPVQEDTSAHPIMISGYNIKYKLYNFTGSGFTDDENMKINDYIGIKEISHPNPFMVNTDFNGDGIIDYLILQKENQDYMTSSYSLIAHSFSDQGGDLDQFADLLDVQYLTIINFNGNAKMDLLVTRNNRTHIYEYSFFDSTFKDISGELDVSFSYKYQLGDFNGDGLTDFTEIFNGGFKLLYSTGKEFEVKTGPYQKAETQFIDNPEELVVANDLNSDGKTDLLRFYFTATREIEITPAFEKTIFTPEIHVYAYLSTGDVFVKKDITSLFSNFEFNEIIYKSKVDMVAGNEISINYELLNTIQIDIHDFPRINFSDFNKDGHSDLIVQRPQDTVAYKLTLVNGEKERMVQCITNGLNINTHINYESLIKSSHYEPGKENGFPIKDYDVPYYVVTNYQEKHNGTTYSDVSIHYTDSKFHARRGFLGFESIEISDTVSGKKQITNYENLTPLYTRAVESTQSYYEDNLISSSSNTNILAAINGLNHTYYRNYKEKISSTNYVTGVNTTKTFSNFNAFYQPQKVVTSYGSDMTITKELGLTNIVDNTYWIPGRKDWVEVRKDHKDGDEVSQKTTYSYTDDFKLSSVTKYADTDMPVSMNYTYDAYGNMASKETTAGSITRKTDYTYTSDHRFLKSKTNDPGNLAFKTEYEYDFVPGKIIKKKDLNSEETIHHYDSFGDRIKTEYPDGNEENSEKNWLENGLKYQIRKTSTTGPAVYETYNMKGQLIEKETSNFSGVIKTSYEYYDNGKIHKEFEPYSDEQGGFVEYFYDDYGRIAEKRLPNGSSITYTYDGLSTVINSPRKTRTEIKDGYGLMDKVIDEGGTINYLYYGDGNLEKVIYDNATYAFEYDAHGNRTKMSDPDAGVIISTYNGMDELISQKDARGNTYTFQYDQVGRMTKRILDGGGETTVWSYDENGNKGYLTGINGQDVDVAYSYDDHYRVSSIQETINGQNYVTAFGYDDKGRENKVVYPTGKTLNKTYTADGFINSVSFDGQEVWSAGEMNEQGQWERFSYGNGLTIHKTFDQITHSPKSVQAGSVFEYHYTFDEIRGNLLSRGDSILSQRESFEYDTLNRLTYSDMHGDVNYQHNGNIGIKEGIGNYEYNTTKPHAVSGITNVAPAYTPEAHNLTFTAFNKIQDIEGDNATLGHTYRQEFTYGPARSRKLVKTYEDGQLLKHKVYAGGIYEEVTNHETGTTRKYHYIHAGSGMVAVFIAEEGASDHLYYIHKDYLGSLLCLTDENGNEVQRYSFDAWGHRRNPTNWNQWQKDSTDYITNRGFTGHEHMDLFGLINMNGRVYDPNLGRFLSPDPYVQMPNNSQNFNRYSYVLNNPLVYTDPSGEFIFTLATLIAAPFTGGASLALLPTSIGADFGMWQGGALANGGEMNPFKWNSGNTLGYMLLGAAVGAASGYVGGAIAAEGGFMANTMGIMAASHVNSVGMGVLSGGQTDYTLSFGAASITMGSQGIKFGHLGKPSNSALENIGYGFGALANLQDINQAINSTDATLYTDDSDLISHSAIADKNTGEPLMSFGPNDTKVPSSKLGYATYFRRSTSDYKIYTTLPVDITVNKYAINLVRGLGKVLPFQGITFNCVNMASLSLWLNGIPNIGLHPYLLYASTWAYSSGIRPDLFSYYFTQYNR